MSRARPTSPSKKHPGSPEREAPPALAPPRKRPLLLALSIALLLGWLAFMVAMAWRNLT
ncbi:MAG: hypothetical protein WD845_13240 [Pirellulales bacterium]